MKMFKRLAAAALAAMLLLLCAAGCGDDSVRGVWSSESIPVGESLEGLIGAISPEYADCYDFSGVGYSLTLEFRRDGTYSAFVSEAENKRLAKLMNDAFCEGFSKQFEIMGAQEELTAEDVAALNGYDSVEKLVVAVMKPEQLADAVANSIRAEGRYAYSDGVMRLTGNAGIKPDMSAEGVPCAVDGSTMIMPFAAADLDGETAAKDMRFTKQDQ